MTRDDIFTVVRDNVLAVVEHIPPDAIREDVSMSDLGADSLQVVEVVSRSMKQLRLRVPRTELSQARNLGDLVDLLEKAARGT